MKKLFVVGVIVSIIASIGFVIIVLIRPSNINIFKNQNLSVEEKLESMTLRQKVASLFIFHKSGYETKELQDYLNKYQPAGLIFMGDNLPESDSELTTLIDTLQTDKHYPYLLAIDEEGGIVKRLKSDKFNSALDLRSLPASETEKAFSQRSKLLKSIGFNLNFGIVADISNNPDSFIYERTFGGDQFTVSQKVESAVIGSKGLTFSTLKHFPGHGETELDSHKTIPENNFDMDWWQKHDELPFKTGIQAGAEFVMFGHLIYGGVDSVPASLSKTWHDILTNQEDFDGISITDDMIMLQQSEDAKYSDPINNTINAINAGNNIILFVLDHGGGLTDIDPDSLINGIIKAVDDGRINKSIINENTKKNLTLRHNLNSVLNN